MIKVNKEGYLYRLALYGTGFETNLIKDNLCPFVRSVIWGICMVIGMTAIGGILTYALLSPIVFGILGLIEGNIAIVLDQDLLVQLGLLIYAILLAIVTILFLCVGFVDVKGRIEESDNIAVNYIAAVHNKLCPKIKFTRE